MAIGVPGEVKGLHAAWKKYGILPWSDLVNYAIELALEGFIVQLRLSEIIQQMKQAIEQDAGLMYAVSYIFHFYRSTTMDKN